MKKIRLGIYIEDSEYGDRLTCYFMNHYKDQLEIHMYTMKEQLIERGLSNVVERIKLIEPPVITMPVSTCEKLVELWKWNEFGDVIRNMTRGISCAG